jgi:hypothetical protein
MPDPGNGQPCARPSLGLRRFRPEVPGRGLWGERWWGQDAMDAVASAGEDGGHRPNQKAPAAGVGPRIPLSQGRSPAEAAESAACPWPS